jgi:hypothetical protein
VEEAHVEEDVGDVDMEDAAVDLDADLDARVHLDANLDADLIANLVPETRLHALLIARQSLVSSDDHTASKSELLVQEAIASCALT